MSNPSLAEILHTTIDTENMSLPIYAIIARRVKNRGDNIDSPDDLRALVEMDPALVCILFRAANASFFKGLKQTGSIEEAINRLGLERSHQIVSQVCRETEGYHRATLIPRYLPLLWQHAVGCALGAWWLANRCGYQGLAQQAYLAGLLHDIGKLFLIASLEDVLSRKEFATSLSDQIVLEMLQSMHVERGLHLATSWQLPDIFHNVIEDHHSHGLASSDITVALVKLANCGCHKIGLGLEQDRSLVLPTTAEAQFLGISEIALAEFEIMLEDRFFRSDHSQLQRDPAHELPGTWSS